MKDGLRRDRDRKRAARARLEPITRDFGAWLREAVVPLQDGPKTWDRLVADISLGDEDDRTLRRYYGGETKRPRPSSAYTIGWALHDVREPWLKEPLEWCSGPVALWAAGYCEQFFRLLSRLASQGPEERYGSIVLAFAVDVVANQQKSYEQALNLPSSVDLESLNPAIRKRYDVEVRAHNEHEMKRRDRARHLLSKISKLRGVIDKAWETKSQSHLEPNFVLAAEILSKANCAEEVRIFGALAAIYQSILSRGSADDVAAVHQLKLISPLSTLEDIADDVLQERLAKLGQA